MNPGLIVGVVGAITTIIGLLVRITYSLGRLVQQFGDHVEQSSRVHADQEARIRALESRRKVPRARQPG